MRTCGECSVCCYIGGVPSIEKGAHSICPHVECLTTFISSNADGCCSLYGKPERPEVCEKFQCSWLRGNGLPEDRPDISGVMCSANRMQGEKFSFVYVIEVSPGALLAEGKAMVERLTELSGTPIIVVDHGSKPPDDKGNRVVVKNKLVTRSTRMMGKFLTYLDDDRSMGVYELVRGG